jgi:hypothetical protein
MIVIFGRSLGRRRRGWVGNIKTDLREIGREDVDWIDQDKGQWRALVNTVKDLRAP